MKYIWQAFLLFLRVTPLAPLVPWIVLIAILVPFLLGYGEKPKQPFPEHHMQHSSVVAEHEHGVLVVDLVDGSDRYDLMALSGIVGKPLEWVNEYTQDEALAQVDVPDMALALEQLQGNPLIEAAEPSIMYFSSSVPNDPMYTKQWHMKAIGMEYVWEHTPEGKGVTVAVLDTGVTKVDDLDKTDVLTGASMVRGEPEVDDYHGHGTHVTGTIAQSTNNGKSVTGIAPKATVLPVKVLSMFGFGTNEWIAAGIDYAADEGAKVINMSLGGPQRSEVLAIAVKKAQERGVIIVAAAGNSGSRDVGFPAAYDGVLAVSAFGPDMLKAPYTSYGPEVDLAAPGGNKQFQDGGVWQETISYEKGQSVEEYQGTSMASPHVAGALAVLLSIPGCDQDCAEQALFDGLKSWGGAKDEHDEVYGYGKLDLEASVKTVDQGGFKGCGQSSPNGLIFPALILAISVGLVKFLAPSTSSQFSLYAGLASVYFADGFRVFMPVIERIEYLNHFKWYVLYPPLHMPDSFVLGWYWPVKFLWYGALPLMGLITATKLFDRPKWFALGYGMCLGTAALLFNAAYNGVVFTSFLGNFMIYGQSLVLLIAALGFVAGEEIRTHKGGK